MLQKITIEGINFKDYAGQDKRTGQPYTAIITGVFDGQRWYSYFDRKGISKSWNRGDTMEFDVTTKTTPNGNEVYNISLPDPVVLMDSRVEKLEKFAAKMVKLLDVAFPGWRDDVYDAPPTADYTQKTQKADNAPLNVEEMVKGVEEMSKAKLTAKQDDTGTNDLPVW